MIGDIIQITNKVFDRLVPDKSKAEKIKYEFNKTFLEIAVKENESLRHFFLEYEGRASEVPHFVLLMRALIRPFFTWLFGLLGAFWVIGQAFGFINKEMPAALSMWVSIVLGFWFGSRWYEKLKGKP
ncbi:hypothetical protein Calab_1464 [Caldithrix abyssi DSM 13497]|uniref:Holin of 3TMs, for gene-transfer release n=1 Tax=Caldithrix abyssi DSM 13497 TaxID=880073 RepID=H1XPV9_CALAY|nr:hypothetical protein [Caldithrix abyssi]APF20386.1 hypothetical protein Cabys_3640 [Caldithrix abyssi DSM 13497]EHO41085.1 hypothetical protein Calab_1464 [Caldithrix abyssi DSM 13497]